MISSKAPTPAEARDHVDASPAAILADRWLDGPPAVVFDDCGGPITDLRPWSNCAGAVSVERMGRETKTERLRHRVDESQGDVEVVTLVGTVGGGHAEKLMAQHVSQGVGGVHDLVDATEVNPASDMRRSGNELRATLEQVPVRAELNRIEVATTAPTPNDVRTAIVEALGLRAGNSASRIDVVVDGSTVTLRGAVQSPAVRAAVVGGFGHAPGISQLRDELPIEADRPPGPER